jgi:hypothetical protein
MRCIAKRLMKIAQNILHSVQTVSRLLENSLHVLVALFDLGSPLRHALSFSQVFVQKPARPL